MKKWWQVAKFILPLVVGQLPEGSPVGKIITIATDAVDAAQNLHGDAHNDAKRQIVVDAVNIATATGKVTIDPVEAMRVTNAVLDSIDAVHKIIQANATLPEVASQQQP